ncbi:MAG TPA: PPOX class F420-dependent oxidoreductase [Dehalococcoidia bacterium]|jgi:PPOX class probable F420-dependent enzyme|nr:PPOX class F420-dependent oxidoreductase [Dehalococcoidia bacterium]
MTDAEVDAFIEQQRTMAVATIGRDGRPHLVAMWYAILDGIPCFWTFAKSQKVVNLRRDPRITCLLEDGDEYSELRGVELVGHAEMTDDEDEVLRFGVAQWERYQGVKVNDALLPAVKKMAAKRVVVRIMVDRVVSWDHRKLGGAY